MVMEHHYSQRKVGTRFCFGMFEDNQLVGCTVFSIPASYTLCKGICGPEYKADVLELSRVVVTTESYCAAGKLVSHSLRNIGNHIVVSYADCNDHVGHLGILDQATNWIYTGQGTAEPKWVHPKTGDVVSFTRRHIDKKAERLGLDWKALQKIPQLGKHRYVIFTGNRRYRKSARRSLRYPVQKYPKGKTQRTYQRSISSESGKLFT